jgi:hypothetical protein
MANSIKITLPDSGDTVTLDAPRASLIRQVAAIQDPADTVFAVLAHCSGLSPEELEALSLEDVLHIKGQLEEHFRVFRLLASE